MHQYPRLGWALIVLAVFISLGLTFTMTYGESDPIIDIPTVYLPAIAHNYSDLLPPPLQAGQIGWLRKWNELEPLPACLALGGTPYYLEDETNTTQWLAAIVETDAVSEVELEVHIDEKVAISGRLEYFDPLCSFPRLYADQLRVLDVPPDGLAGHSLP